MAIDTLDAPGETTAETKPLATLNDHDVHRSIMDHNDDQHFPAYAPKAAQEGWLDAKAGRPVEANPYVLGHAMTDVMWTHWLAGHYLFKQGCHQDPESYEAALALADETRALRSQHEWAERQRSYIAEETRRKTASICCVPIL